MASGVSRTGLLLGASIAVAIEAASNASYAFKLGGQLVLPLYGVPVPVDGVVLAAAAIGVALYQANAATAVVHGPDRGLAALFLAVCLVISTTTLVLHVLELQRWHANKAPDEAKYRRLDREYSRLEKELEDLGTPRPADVIANEIKSVTIVDRVWRVTKQCSENLADVEHARFCKPILELYKERAKRARVSELEPKLAQLRQEMGALQRPAVVGRSSAEAALMEVFPWLFAGVVELLATFGFAFARRGASVQGPLVRRVPPGGGRLPLSPGGSEGASRAPAGKRPDVLSVLGGIRQGKLQVAGARTFPDGSVYAPQAAIGAVTGTSKTTINRELNAAVLAGNVTKVSQGGVTAYKII